LFKWQRRAAKLDAKKRKIVKHGKGMAQQYKQVLLNRLGAKKFGIKESK